MPNSLDCEQRKEYDATGRIEKSANEEFMENFGGGEPLNIIDGLSPAIRDLNNH